VNRVKKVSRKWEEARDGSLAVLASNKAATKRRKLRYAIEMWFIGATHGVRATGTVEPVGVVRATDAPAEEPPIESTVDADKRRGPRTDTVPVGEVLDGEVQQSLSEYTVASLRMMCVSLGLKGYSKANKPTLIAMIEEATT